MKEKIILNVYPGNKNSLIWLSLNWLRFPENTDYSSLEIKGNKKLPFDIIDKEESLAIINDGSKKIVISYDTGRNNKKLKKTNEKIKIKNKKIFTRDVSIKFGEDGNIKNFKIRNKDYGPLALIASGGVENILDGKFSLIADSPILKVIEINGRLKCEGKKADKEGHLPVKARYSFWSSDGKNIFGKAEIELLYENAVDFNGEKLPYLDPNIWFRLDSNEKVNYNSYFENAMDENDKIVTLKRPYYAFIKNFGIFPCLALPCDGLHIEVKKGEWFGAAWHSLSKPKKPYWDIIEKDSTKLPQGYYPAHSLNSYWRIGLFFGEGNFKETAEMFTYEDKIRNAVHDAAVGNPYVTRWPDNKAMAFNAITDDEDLSEYYWRANGTIPKWVENAIPTRQLFGISYYCYGFFDDKCFYFKPFSHISTLFNTICVKIGLCKSFKQKFDEIDGRLIPHTNLHPPVWKCSAERIRKEMKISERTWVKKWKYRIPLSHVFSFTSPYDIPTEEGTREKIAFSASKYLQWIREWYIPNAPTDFFLPSRLYWGFTVGNDLQYEKVCNQIKEEFNNLYGKADYMIIGGHFPHVRAEKGPDYLKNLFSYLESKKDVWFATADEIIRYYKNRKNLVLGRFEKENNYFAMEIKNGNSADFFNCDLTLMQSIKKKILMLQYSVDGIKWLDIVYKRNKDIVQYNIPSSTKKIRLKVE